MVSAVYKTLRSAISSRYPALTLTYHRERKSLKELGMAEPIALFRSRDTLRQINQMAQARPQKNEALPSLDEDKLPAITVCIVTYNSEAWVRDWVKALADLNYPRPKLKLSWVDNGSTDETINQLNKALLEFGFKDFANTLIIQENLGFGAGQNLAVQKAETNYVLIINPDTKLETNSLRYAVNFAVKDFDDISCWEFAQTPHEHPKYYDPVTLETSWNSHACVLVKRSAFLKAGGYDETLFMYGEDVELSYKLRANRYRLRYLPKARVSHDTTPNPSRRQEQESRCIAANLLLRRRYGRLPDRIAGKLLLKLTSLRATPNAQETLESAKDIYSNLKFSFSPKRPNGALFPFNGWEYDKRRLNTSTASKIKPINLAQKRETNPLVSIITRVHKNTPILYDAVNCVRNQTYSNIEHIIVFDGCEPLALDNIIAVKSNQTGRSKAANRGAAAAKGKYLLFLDYDDLLFADHIEGLVNHLNTSSEAVCAYSYSWEGMARNRNKGTYVCLGLQNKMETQFKPDALTHNNFFAIQSVLIKREAFETIGGFDITLEYCEDWDLWKRLLKLGEFASYPRLTSIYFTPASLKDRILRSWSMARTDKH